MQGLIITYPGHTFEEVEPAVALLSGKFEVKVIGLDEITPDLDPDFLLIPGGSCEHAVVHKPLHRLIRQVHAKSGLLAGICNGALVLASAGVLKGRKCTHTAHPKYAPLPQFKELLDAAAIYFAGSIYVDEDAVLDGNIFTTKPRATEAYASGVLEYLNRAKTR